MRGPIYVIHRREWVRGRLLCSQCKTDIEVDEEYGIKKYFYE